MSSETLEIENRVARIQGRTSRTQSIATRFTRSEEKVLLKRAEASGQNLREWAREVLLREARSASEVVNAEALLTEIVGLQLFLTNALAPVACGEQMRSEQYQELMRQVKTNKHEAVREVIAQYAVGKKE